MSEDFFSGRAMSQDAPASRLAAVIPDDAADLPGGVTRALYVGGGGAVTLTDASGATVTIVSGDTQYHPIRVRRILAAGTTATNVVALY